MKAKSSIVSLIAVISCVFPHLSCFASQREEIAAAFNGARQLQVAIQTYVSDKQATQKLTSVDVFPSTVAELDDYLDEAQIKRLEALGRIELFKPSKWPGDDFIIARLTITTDILNIAWQEGFSVNPSE